MAFQKSFTSVAVLKQDIVDGHNTTYYIVKDLHKDLQDFAGNFPSNIKIHFMRWILITDSQIELNNNNNINEFQLEKKYLVFTMNYDDDLDEVLQSLFKYENAKILIDKIYSKCIGFDRYANASKIEFLKKNSIKEELFWVGKPGWSLARIKAEQAIKNKMQLQLSLIPSPFDFQKAEEIRREYYKVIKKLNNTQRKTSSLFFRIIKNAFKVVILIPVIVVVLPISIYKYFTKKMRKKNTTPQILRYNDSTMPGENVISQNQLSIHGVLKRNPTFYWYLKFKFALAVARFLGSFMAKGKLGKIDSIHFVKWLMIPNKIIDKNYDKSKIIHCLFLTDYDGTWEGYISNFIDLGARAINFTFSNLTDYPEISFLYNYGAFTGVSFKHVVRSHQLNCPLWYSNYRNISMRDKIQNAKIIEMAGKKSLNQEEMKSWLSMFN